MTHLNYIQLQKEKRAKERNKIIKEVLIALLIIIGMLVIFSWAGGTYPY